MGRWGWVGVARGLWVTTADKVEQGGGELEEHARPGAPCTLRAAWVRSQRQRLPRT